MSSKNSTSMIKKPLTEELTESLNIDEEINITEELNLKNHSIVNTFDFTENKDTPSSIEMIQAASQPEAPGKQKGVTPLVDGEAFDVKRSYQLRNSTVRMLNELKAKHPDVNVYLNSIVDQAIRNYYDYIISQGNQQK